MLCSLHPSLTGYLTLLFLNSPATLQRTPGHLFSSRKTFFPLRNHCIPHPPSSCQLSSGWPICPHLLSLSTLPSFQTQQSEEGSPTAPSGRSQDFARSPATHVQRHSCPGRGLTVTLGECGNQGAAGLENIHQRFQDSEVCFLFLLTKKKVTTFQTIQTQTVTKGTHKSDRHGP